MTKRSREPLDVQLPKMQEKRTDVTIERDRPSISVGKPADAEVVHGEGTPAVKITFYGHFGTLNTGNESTLIAILERLRSFYPDAHFLCVCTGPNAVTARDGIDAVPINTRTTRLWNRQRPLYARLAMLLAGGLAELGQWVRALRTMKGSEMLIVPGTGLLTDAYGLHAWGPYNLMKWTVAARLRGCRILFMSVGAGPLYSTAGRLCTKSALILADYASFRDPASVRYLEAIGFRTRGYHVYPDLAFDLLPGNLVPEIERPRERRRRLVGLGLMEYAGRYSVENPDPVTYSRYLDALATFVEWLLGRDYDVRLLLGDSDGLVIEELESLLQDRVEEYSEERVFYEPRGSVQEMLLALSECDVVVATRFHNVILSLLLEKPVIAISFHHKCAALMEQLGMSAYCQDIHQLNSRWLIEQFEELEANSEEIERSIREGVEAQRKDLEEQYTLLFGRPVSGRRRRSHMAPR
jgi:polysaccharide pyruvyl transferase WcaK-like protein